LQGVVYVCGFAVRLIDQFSRQGVVAVASVTLFRYNTVAVVEYVGRDVGGMGDDAVEGIVDLRFQFTASGFPQAVA
jgi:hypothetical protein